jgi:hypothetical protein
VGGEERIGEVATQELFRLRRTALVDGCWHFGFVAGFGVAGVVAFSRMSASVATSPAQALLRYILILFAAGLACGMFGVGVGHVAASWWQRRDLKRHPRYYEP